mmetsp:Transcript_46607/g.134896  ORF Transcript_46607/g.134896 Transcript_46607/m.134896 type:complete len:1333 (-) Transcript_46607:65-4063(-)
MVMPECSKSMDLIAKLTGVQRANLEGAMCNTTRVTRTEKIRSPVNVRTASDNRDALAKALYGMVFNFIVSKTNLSIGYRTDVKLFVGVLDIFGFECFKMNSFEQLCINFTNERLQQFFNSFVFKLEEQLYEREGIPWDALDFPDNQDSVDILAAKTVGVFAILDEECVVPQGSDQGFCNKLIKQHKGHRRFDEIKTKPTWFVIKHFAGPVNYCTDSFLDKNKDQLSNDLIECMGGSANEFVANLFQKDPKYIEVLGKDTGDQKVGGKKKKYTVSSEFKDQLSSLMDIVDLTEPHFIRCIKPNPQNEPDRYDRKAVTEQLRYGGVLQVVQVSRAGYPVRVNHQECWDDYKIIAAPQQVQSLKHIDDGKLRAQKLLEHLSTELNIPMPTHGQSWAVGKSLVFFKLGAFERIKFARLELLIKSTTLIQADWRRMVQKEKYKALVLFTKHVQALMRSKQARIDADRHRRELAVRKIQSLARRTAARKSYRAIRNKVVRLQAWRKGILGRRSAKEYRRFSSARKIQQLWRRRSEQKVYKLLMTSVHVAQERWRMHYAKQQMKKLKQEAKEVGALMAKNQKAQEQATEQRKKNEELEAQMLQLQSEKGKLQTKVKQMEDQTQEMHQQLEAEKVKAEEVTKKVAECAKAKLVEEALGKLQVEMEEKEGVIKSLTEELNKLKATQENLTAEHARAESLYKSLLKSSAMQSVNTLQSSNLATLGPGARGPAAGASAAGVPRQSMTKMAANRNVFIQLVGATNVGKSMLLESLIRAEDEQQLAKFNEQKPNLMSHHHIQIGERLLKVLDCSGNLRAQHLVREWFTRSIWVFVVYDMANARTLDHALELTKEVHNAGARLLLLGNRFNVEKGEPCQVDLTAAKDAANRLEGFSCETSSLVDAVKLVLTAEDFQGAQEGGDPQAVGQQLDALSPDGNRRSSISAAIDSVKSWFGGAAERSSGRNGQSGVLRPSLKGTRAMKSSRRDGDLNADLKPTQELQDSESAVTCIVFGQERQHKSYILLATASKDGTVVCYRVNRTEMELDMVKDMEFVDDVMPEKEKVDHSNIAVQCRLVGHSRAITSIFFNMNEDQLVTTSIDKSVRFWCIESSEMMKVFTDSWPVPTAQFLPCNPQVFVAANSNAVLRLVNVANGMVLQKLKVETEVRALKFDDSGMFLLAGTKSGSIHVLECSENSMLKFKFKVQLARGGVTCIHYVPARDGQPPCLLVNTSDSNATIIDMTYGPPAGILTNLAVRHRVRVAHSLLPLKCTYSPSGQGYLISGSEDKEVYIYNLGRGQNYKMQYLKHHAVPVVAVAVNMEDTLLASADSLGHIVLWRRMDFSHLPD